MRTLLILVCERDVSLGLQLLKRLTFLSAWSAFSKLRLHLDRSVNQKEHDDLRRAAPDQIAVEITTAHTWECWNTRRAETMLSVYKMSCSDKQDIIRMDPDVFIASPRFIDAVSKEHHGIAGKLMRLHLPAQIKGEQLKFIQGGVSCWGKEGRSFLETLENSDIVGFRRRYQQQIEGMSSNKFSQYAYYFNRTEDVILTGALATIAGITRTHIENLQVSPYDVIRDHRSEIWTYDDFVSAYERSGAFAFHFEGGHSGRRAKMTEMLTRYYECRSASENGSLS
jgi:hypothetical protein